MSGASFRNDMSGIADFFAELGGNLTGYADDTETVSPVRGKADLEDSILDAECLKNRCTKGKVCRQHHDAWLIHRQGQLFFGAEHAARLFTANFGALYLEITGESGTQLGQAPPCRRI